MKIQDLLNEMPLPVDWDKSKFNARTSFNKLIAYAKEKAQRIGSGSSRVAFEVPYEGRKTVLKVAKNKKGIAQNIHEVSMFGEHVLQQFNMIIPMIDYDEESDDPIWIHTEFATKATQNDFKQRFGYNLNDLMMYVKNITGKERDMPNDLLRKMEEQLDGIALVNGLIFLMNYDIHYNDFEMLQNWGIYQNRPVLIDLGASSEIMASLY